MKANNTFSNIATQNIISQNVTAQTLMSRNGIIVGQLDGTPNKYIYTDVYASGTRWHRFDIGQDQTFINSMITRRPGSWNGDIVNLTWNTDFAQYSASADTNIMRVNKDFIHVSVPINSCPTIISLQSTVNNLQGGSANNNDVIALQSKTTTNSIISVLAANTNQINTNVNNISSLVGNITTNNADIIGLKKSVLLASIKSNGTSISTLRNTTDSIIGNLSSMHGQITTNVNKISSLLTSTNANIADIIGLKTLQIV